MMIGLWNPTVLGNDLGVESGFVESPFWHSFVRVHCLLEPRRLRTHLLQGCNHGAHSTKQPSKVTNNYYA